MLEVNDGNTLLREDEDPCDVRQEQVLSGLKRSAQLGTSSTDRDHILAVSLSDKRVKNARISKTHFQSPQLSLFELDDDDWSLFLKLPDYAPRLRRRQATTIQPPLFDDPQAEHA